MEAIDKFLRKYKVNEKTKIDIALLIELLDLWGKEQKNFIPDCIETLEFTRKRLVAKELSCFEIDGMIDKLKRLNGEPDKQYATLTGNVTINNNPIFE